ncbi:hypothetical protein PR048_023112 [Dryococelus australis]|uniref:Secreted protein n=1 Tax=Dryococelus australis TaxID=614101 RepID=A0ABQ9GT72_9NEOP|nr:hypothetical protein PR048_023112 [Dryococelus australis]
MYRYNVLWMGRWLVVPRWLSRLSSVTLGWALRSSAPQEGSIGATLEIQRAQQLEVLEQQVLLSRARDMRRQVTRPCALQHYAFTSYKCSLLNDVQLV